MRYMFCVLLHMCATALSLTLLHHIGSDSCCDLCDHTPIHLENTPGGFVFVFSVRVLRWDLFSRQFCRSSRSS